MKRFTFFLCLGVFSFIGTHCAFAVDIIKLSSYPSSIRTDTTVNLLSIDFEFFLSEQKLIVFLSEGEIIYDPCPVCDVAVDDTSTSVFLGAPDNLPPSLQVDSMTDAKYNVTWSPAPLSITRQSNYLVARVALTNNAKGTWSYIGAEDFPTALLPTPPTLGGTVVNGVMIQQVPEPSSMMLFWAIGALLMGKRKIGARPTSR